MIELCNGKYIDEQMQYNFGGPVYFGDSANLDAFSRLRVSNPLTLFSSQFTYNLNPLLFEVIAESPDSFIEHDTLHRCAAMYIAASTGVRCLMQSYEYFPYQPGKSQLVFVTFNMQEAVADVKKFAGLFDDSNGFQFRLNGTDKEFVILSDSIENAVAQSSWNLDKLDGTGTSGITLDITKIQILVLDFQALYAGRVRMGFDIGGRIIYAHEFLHANINDFPYIQTANLPVRCGMISEAAADTRMRFICCSVQSEGGIEDANAFGYAFVQDSGLINAAATATHVLSLRPRILFNGFYNRIRVAYIDVEFFNNGNQPVFWQLCIGQDITGSTGYTNVNTDYSSVEYNNTGTLSGTPAIIIDEGYVSSSGSAKATVNTEVFSRYPITLDASGAHRLLGTLTLTCTSISGTQPVYAAIKFKEIR